MLRTWIVCALLGAISIPASAPAAEKDPNETVIHFTVSPAALPKPALKYLLLPELKEMTPGNPIQGYLKCFMEQQNFFYNKEVVEQRERWLNAPLNELPNLSGYGGSALRHADEAARLESPDWQISLKLRTEGVNLLLPEVQQLRMLALALKVRFRGGVKDRRFEDGARSAEARLA